MNNNSDKPGATGTIAVVVPCETVFRKRRERRQASAQANHHAWASTLATVQRRLVERILMRERRSNHSPL